MTVLIVVSQSDVDIVKILKYITDEFKWDISNSGSLFPYPLGRAVATAKLEKKLLMLMMKKNKLYREDRLHVHATPLGF